MHSAHSAAIGEQLTERLAVVSVVSPSVVCDPSGDLTRLRRFLDMKLGQQTR